MKNRSINPFEFNSLYHYKLTFDELSKFGERKISVLDYGCGNAEFIVSLRSRNRKLFGFDVNREQITKNKKKFPDIKFFYGKVNQKLPFKNSVFDVIFLFHVLEHVDSEDRVLSEVKRVLKPGGLLFFASPFKGIFSWADAANFRYVFPGMHKLFYSLIFGSREYKKLYGKSGSPLYGDITAIRSWHKHYTKKEITKLMRVGFKIEKLHLFSVFHPFINIINIFDSYLTKRPLKNHGRWIKYLFYLDNRIYAGTLSWNFLTVASKV